MRLIRWANATHIPEAAATTPRPRRSQIIQEMALASRQWPLRYGPTDFNLRHDVEADIVGARPAQCECSASSGHECDYESCRVKAKACALVHDKAIKLV